MNIEWLTNVMGVSDSIHTALTMGAHNRDIAVDLRGIRSSIYVESEWRETIIRQSPNAIGRADWEEKHHTEITEEENDRIFLHHIYGSPPESGQWKIIDFMGEIIRRFDNRAQSRTYMTMQPFTDFIIDDENFTVYTIPVKTGIPPRSPRERFEAQEERG